MKKENNLFRPAESSTPIADLMDEFDKLEKRYTELKNYFDKNSKIEIKSLERQMCDLSDQLTNLNK